MTTSGHAHPRDRPDQPQHVLAGLDPAHEEHEVVRAVECAEQLRRRLRERRADPVRDDPDPLRIDAEEADELPRLGQRVGQDRVGQAQQVPPPARPAGRDPHERSTSPGPRPAAPGRWPARRSLAARTSRSARGPRGPSGAARPVPAPGPHATSRTGGAAAPAPAGRSRGENRRTSTPRDSRCRPVCTSWFSPPPGDWNACDGAWKTTARGAILPRERAVEPERRLEDGGGGQGLDHRAASVRRPCRHQRSPFLTRAESVLAGRS